MNSVVVVLIGLAVAFIGYRVYAKYIDTKIMKADPKKATPAKMYMDGVEFMPTSKSILFGYQFKSIAGAAPIIGPIMAIQWGWFPALIWILGRSILYRLGSRLFERHDRHEARRAHLLGRLSHELISPRARVILLSFIYFYLLLIAGAFGNVVVSTAIGLKAAPMAWLFPDDWRGPGWSDDLQVEEGYHHDHRGYRGHCPDRDMARNRSTFQYHHRRQSGQ